MKCDVSREDDIMRVFSEIVEKFGGSKSLINNAGILRSGSTTEADNSEKLRAVMNTNVLGLAFCTRQMFQSIRKRNVDGHIIHINSIAGHFTQFHKEFDSFGIFGATKYAATALAEQQCHEFIKHITSCPNMRATHSTHERDLLKI